MRPHLDESAALPLRQSHSDPNDVTGRGARPHRHDSPVFAMQGSRDTPSAERDPEALF